MIGACQRIAAEFPTSIIKSICNITVHDHWNNGEIEGEKKIDMENTGID